MSRGALKRLAAASRSFKWVMRYLGACPSMSMGSFAEYVCASEDVLGVETGQHDV